MLATGCKKSETAGADDGVERYRHIAGKFEEFYIGCGAMVDGIPDVNSVGDEDKHVIDRLPQVVKSDSTGELQLIVDEFLETTELEARYDLAERLLNAIFETDKVEETNEFFSDKRLALINAFWASEPAKPPYNEDQAYWLEQTYQYLVGHYMCSMVFATVKDEFNYVKAYKYEDGTVYPYTEYFTKHIFYGVLLGAYSDRTLADLSMSMAHFAKLSDKSWRINIDLRAYLDARLKAPDIGDSEEEKLTHALEVMDGAVYGAIRAEDSGGVLDGTEKADVMVGGSGNDTLNGGASHDWLIGGGGNDVLDGGAGNDCLEGGSGDDVYVFRWGSGSDIIIDFDGNNTIRIEDFSPEEMTARSFSDDGLQNDVMLCNTRTSDTLVIKNYFLNDMYRRFELEFGGVTIRIDSPESPLSRIDQEPETDVSEPATSVVIPY